MAGKRIAISFSSKKGDQELLTYLESKKEEIGISEFIKDLIKKDMELNKEEN